MVINWFPTLWFRNLFISIIIETLLELSNVQTSLNWISTHFYAKNHEQPSAQFCLYDLFSEGLNVLTLIEDHYCSTSEIPSGQRIFMLPHLANNRNSFPITYIINVTLGQDASATDQIFPSCFHRLPLCTRFR